MPPSGHKAVQNEKSKRDQEWTPGAHTPPAAFLWELPWSFIQVEFHPGEAVVLSSKAVPTAFRASYAQVQRLPLT